MSDNAAESQSDKSDAQARSARRKRWDRITWGVIIVLVAVWAVAIFYRDELREAWWTWRREAQRSAAMADALEKSRSDDAFVRAAGAGQMAELLREQYRLRLNEELARRARGEGPPEEIAPDIDANTEMGKRLRELLNDPSPMVQAEAIAGLEMLADSEVLDDLARLAEGEDPVIACRATEAIGNIGPDDQARPVLLGLVQSSDDPNVRAHAVEAMRFSVRREDLPVLVVLLHDTREVTIRPASGGLDPKVLAQIQRQVFGRDAGLLPPPASQPEEKERMTVADYAVRLLRKMTGKTFGFDVDAPDADREQAIRLWREEVGRLGA